MNGALTTYGATQVMSLLTGGTPTSPAHTYLALSSTDFGESGAGGTEPGSGGYARQSLTWTNTGGAVQTQAPITFPTLTGAWSPGSSIHLRYAGVFDAASGGNCIVRFDVGDAVNGLPLVGVGQQVTFGGAFSVAGDREIGDTGLMMKESFMASLLGHVLGAASYSAPALYLGLAASHNPSGGAPFPTAYTELNHGAGYASGYSRQAYSGWGADSVIGSGTYAGVRHAPFTTAKTFGPLVATVPGGTLSLPSDSFGCSPCLFDASAVDTGNLLARFASCAVTGPVVDGDTLSIPASLLYWWVDS